MSGFRRPDKRSGSKNCKTALAQMQYALCMTWSQGTKPTMLDGKWRCGTLKNIEMSAIQMF